MSVTYSVELLEATINKQVDRIEVLEKHKRLQTEDVMNLGAQLGQARLRIEQLEAALRKIACKHVTEQPLW